MSEIITRLRPVYVQWLDAANQTGYFRMGDDIDFPLAEMETVGWLLRAADDVLIVAQTTGVGKVGDVLTIPRSAVVMYKEWEDV